MHDHELARLLRSFASRADRVALVEALEGEPRLAHTYSALLGRVHSVRAAMARLALQPGDCIAVCSRRPARQVIAWLAGMANGLVVHLHNPTLPPAMRRTLAEHAMPQAMVFDDAAGDDATVPPGTRTVEWSALFDAPAQPGPLPPTPPAAGGLLVYTSGTTGTPKGVLLRWHQLRENAAHAVAALGLEPGWVTGSLLPRYHTFTLVSDVLPALLLGGRCVLADTFELPHAPHIVQAFARNEVRSYSAAPIILQGLAALGAWDRVPSLRMAVQGAAPLTERARTDYGEAFAHPIVPCYGLSETTCFAAISPPRDVRPGSVGLPAGIGVRVLDDDGHELPPGTDGELAMRGVSVIDAYHRDTEGRFADAFTHDGWFRSGDIGRIDADGRIRVTGRRKNMAIRGGEKIHLEDVDRCLSELDGVLDCASIVRLVPGAPDEAITFIVPGDKALLPRERIDACVRARLTGRHVPDRVVFVSRLPRTRTGKLAHDELLALVPPSEAAP